MFETFRSRTSKRLPVLFFLTSCFRVQFQEVGKKVSACRISFVIERSGRTFVSVEQVSAQETPTSSSNKTYTSLQVATSRTPGQPIATESPDVRPLQIDKEPITEAPVTSPTIETPSGSHEETPHCKEVLLTTSGPLTLRSSFDQNPWTPT